MKSILIFNDLWPYVDGILVKPITNTDIWAKNEALTLISLSVTYDQFNHIKNAHPNKHGTSSRTCSNLEIR